MPIIALMLMLMLTLVILLIAPLSPDAADVLGVKPLYGVEHPSDGSVVHTGAEHCVVLEGSESIVANLVLSAARTLLKSRVSSILHNM